MIHRVKGRTKVNKTYFDSEDRKAKESRIGSEWQLLGRFKILYHTDKIIIQISVT